MAVRIRLAFVRPALAVSDAGLARLAASLRGPCALELSRITTVLRAAFGTGRFIAGGAANAAILTTRERLADGFALDVLAILIRLAGAARVAGPVTLGARLRAAIGIRQTGNAGFALRMALGLTGIRTVARSQASDADVLGYVTNGPSYRVRAVGIRLTLDTGLAASAADLLGGIRAMGIARTLDAAMLRIADWRRLRTMTS
jgi:hypothetical protein